MLQRFFEELETRHRFLVVLRRSVEGAIEVGQVVEVRKEVKKNEY